MNNTETLATTGKRQRILQDKQSKTKHTTLKTDG